MDKAREIDRFWSKTTWEGDCRTWTGSRNEDGYGFFWSGGKGRKAHRVAYEIAKGPIPVGMLVCHHCDNPRCVRVEHLFLGNASDNMKDAVRKGRLKTINSTQTHFRSGRAPFGESAARTKLKEAQVLARQPACHLDGAADRVFHARQRQR